MFQSEIWPRLQAVTFHQGDVIKPYNEYTKDVFIIFEGEVDIISPVIKKNAPNEEIVVNTYGPGDLLGD